MSRIEIPLTEYNGYKNKIKALETTVTDISKEAAFYKEKYQDAESLVEDLKSEGIISRAFKWKSVIEPLVELFTKKYGETSRGTNH